MTSSELKAALMRVFDEAMNKNNPGVLDQVIHPQYVNHDFPTPSSGPEGVKTILNMFRSSFPDIHVTVEQSVAEGNKVATRGYFTGTHKGDFMGVKPTGKSIKVTYSDIWAAEDDKFKDNWVQMDIVGMMQQLGVMPKA